MKMKRKNRSLSEEDIDALVIAQSEDESAWSKSLKVRRAKTASVSLPSALAARAVFFARLHRETRLNDWLMRVIKERIDLEEAAFTGLKRELVAGARKSRL